MSFMLVLLHMAMKNIHTISGLAPPSVMAKLL